MTLGDVVKGLMGGDATIEEDASRVEEWGQTNAFLSELTQTKGVSGGLARTALRSQTTDGVVELGPSGAEDDSSEPPDRKATEARRDLVAIASGNLGLIYFPRIAGRVTLEQLAATYPGLIDSLAAHPGVGALLIRSDQHGALVIGRSGINFLDEDRIEGDDPVAQYGGRSREALIRLDAIDHTADVSVISLFDPAFEEVAAFEELIGLTGLSAGSRRCPSCCTQPSGTSTRISSAPQRCTDRSDVGRNATSTCVSARTGRLSRFPCPRLPPRR